ncbi:unnamed protein product [Vicia faba]|uniref:Uncharacterized protein n=1 Tax=Vicia faba TaxID=3906 RepID=A0AAV0ZWK4_VICFA|nr:unnamed protein product [Vicia faba]
MISFVWFKSFLKLVHLITRSMWLKHARRASIEKQVAKFLHIVKLEAPEWKNKPILFYDKLTKLFGKDQTTGEHEDTFAEIRTKKAANVEKSYGITIKEIDHLVETNEVILEGFDDEKHHFNNYLKRSYVINSQDVSSSRTKKQVKKSPGFSRRYCCLLLRFQLL